MLPHHSSLAIPPCLEALAANNPIANCCQQQKKERVHYKEIHMFALLIIDFLIKYRK